MVSVLMARHFLPRNPMALCRCYRLRGNRLVRATILTLLLLLYCEWLHYFVVLLQCTWPRLQTPVRGGWSSGPEDLKVMFLADTHLLGFREGHWFDKVRREWQMQRAFQTSMLLHQPDVVFILGDLLDEGKWCDDGEFKYHVERFDDMFSVPSGTRRHLVVGNHDIGFHYMITSHKKYRFEEAFGSPSVAVLNIQGLVFVLLNSMAMEGDGCDMCSEAEDTLQKVSTQLRCAKGDFTSGIAQNECQKHEIFPYSQPILLQHFPLYRPSDINCSTQDAAPPEEKIIAFKPRHDTLSKQASQELLKLLDPRLVIGAHIHHGCYRMHENGVPEWTVASFSWRNKKNPSFLMARISREDHKVHLCLMPDERTVFLMYIIGGCVICLTLLPFSSSKFRKTS